MSDPRYCHCQEENETSAEEELSDGKRKEGGKRKEEAEEKRTEGIKMGEIRGRRGGGGEVSKNDKELRKHKLHRLDFILLRFKRSNYEEDEMKRKGRRKKRR